MCRGGRFHVVERLSGSDPWNATRRVALVVPPGSRGAPGWYGGPEQPSALHPSRRLHDRLCAEPVRPPTLRPQRACSHQRKFLAVQQPRDISAIRRISVVEYARDRLGPRRAAIASRVSGCPAGRGRIACVLLGLWTLELIDRPGAHGRHQRAQSTMWVQVVVADPADQPRKTVKLIGCPTASP